MFHAIASGHESVNLDTFMSSPDGVCRAFGLYGSDADCCVVEGVMGLYDGYDRWHGSSAEVADLLGLPVILLVNAQSVAYSVAPLIYGFCNFRTSEGTPRKVFVVFNQVASANHYSYLKAACDDAGAVCLGYMARNNELVVPGRHLGLTITEREAMERVICLASEEVEAHVDIDLLLKECGGAGQSTAGNTACDKCANYEADETQYAAVDKLNALFGTLTSSCAVTSGSRICIARDEAFNFTYRANIDALRAVGKVTFFSPLSDAALPPCDFLYLPGGYPELFADRLAANLSMRESIRSYAAGGGKVFAECGGYMYLCRSIDTQPMCDVLPFTATMQGARLHLGYRILNLQDPSGHPFTLRGHEFHYSTVNDPAEAPQDMAIIRSQTSARHQPVSTPLYVWRNVVAGYTHWYF